MNNSSVPFLIRIAAKLHQAQGRHGCWEWIGPTADSRGRGTIMLSGKHRLAHAALYEYANGAIPAGLEFDHLCKNPRCCNPDHLEPVTHRVNMERYFVDRKKITHCKNGHFLGGYNLYMPPSGGRKCRICGVARTTRYNTKMKLSRLPAERDKGAG